MPACSEGTCPITINAFFFPSLVASAAYSTVSPSLFSSTSTTSTLSISSACVSRSNPADPGLNASFVTFISGFPTTRNTGVFRNESNKAGVEPRIGGIRTGNTRTGNGQRGSIAGGRNQGVGNGGICSGRDQRGEEEGIDRDWTRALRAGGHGGVRKVDENVCERRADRVCADQTAVLDACGEKCPTLKDPSYEIQTLATRGLLHWACLDAVS